jgi:hypothetical protein
MEDAFRLAKESITESFLTVSFLFGSGLTGGVSILLCIL